MKVLESSVKYLSILGIGSSIAFFKAFQTYISLAIYFGLFFCASFISILKHHNNFDGTANAFLLFSAGIASCGAFLSFGINAKKVMWVTDQYQSLVDECN